jgi:hypothetical protein
VASGLPWTPPLPRSRRRTISCFVAPRRGVVILPLRRQPHQTPPPPRLVLWPTCRHRCAGVAWRPTAACLTPTRSPATAASSRRGAPSRVRGAVVRRGGGREGGGGVDRALGHAASLTRHTSDCIAPRSPIGGPLDLVAEPGPPPPPPRHRARAAAKSTLAHFGLAATPGGGASVVVGYPDASDRGALPPMGTNGTLGVSAPWHQLVSGLVWLVRNGSSHVDAALVRAPACCCGEWEGEGGGGGLLRHRGPPRARCGPLTSAGQHVTRVA